MTDQALTPDPQTSLSSLGTLANTIARQTILTDYQTRKSAQTLRRQKADLALFAQFLAEAELDPLGQAGAPVQLVEVPRRATFYAQSLVSDLSIWQGVTWGLVQSFLHWQLGRGYAIGSINVRLATVKAYAHLARKYGSLSDGEYAMIKVVSSFDQAEGHNADEKREQTRVGHKKPDPLPLSPAHLGLLKRRPDTPRGRRDALLLYLMLDLGFRCGEIRDLDVTDVSIERGMIGFYRHKVHKDQTHAMTPDVLLAARAYLQEVPHGQVPLFVGVCSKARIDERSINARVASWGHEIGIVGPSPLSPHDLRHDWTTRAFRGGSALDRIQDAGGWNSPAMPLRYAEKAKIANEGIKLA